VKRWSAAVYVAVYLVLFALTAAFRFLALRNGFPNDHFLYISGGRQMLFGEWPTRDFIDPGMPFMFAASALAQKIVGQTLLAEAMLVSIAFGLGAALTAAAVRELTGSLTLAIVAVVFEVAAFPRTYSYPKVALYAAAFWLYGRYLRRPTFGRSCAIAAIVAVAFMFRHDHGLYLWVGGVLATLLNVESRSWKAAARSAVIFTAVVLLLVLPYLIYVQAYAGLSAYIQAGIEFSRREAGRQWHIWPTIFGDERPFESALVYELHLLPLIAIAALVAARRRAEFWQLAARVFPLAVVAVLVNFSFIRDPLGTRLADAIVPAVILGAWLASRAWQPARLRAITIPVALVYAGLMAASVLTVGSTFDELDRADLFVNPSEIPRRFPERAAALRARFTDNELPTRAARMLIPFFRYTDRCTAPGDRLLVGGFLVEAPFYAQRLFAGGQEYFDGIFDSPANQRAALEHLRRQDVPFMILPSDVAAEFDQRFPLVAGYVHARYTPLTDVAIDDEQTIHILVSRDMPAAARDPETGWPCFRPQPIS
jgi:hypothetical protein